MDELINIYSNLKNYDLDLNINLELELRIKILPPENFKSYKNQNITYYRSTIYPSVTFRKYENDIHIYTKEVIEKRKDNNILYVLSIEKKNTHFHLKIPLIESVKRYQERMLICESPLAEIIKYGDEYTLEIEYTSYSQLDKINKLIQKYNCPYYPSKKPMEISINNLTKELLDSPDSWYLSFKADGVHVLVIDDKILYDNGKITDLDGNNSSLLSNPKNVYEAEIMDNNKLLYFDCIMYNGELLTDKPLNYRLKYIDEQKWIKEYFPLDFKNLCSILYYVPNFKSDGFIITNSFKTYKSKFINTVDLRYKNGYLLLENEDISERVPRTKFDYKENVIYEFNINMELIRERNDKTIANYKFPYENNPLYNIAFGIGVPSLRVINNRIKFKLLSMLDSGTLVDIGSAKGGDMLKWLNLNFDTIYAVDPNINFRYHNLKIIEIKEKVQDLPSFIKYDYVSILFVPWDPYFTKIIANSKKSVIAIMDNPINYECPQFSCKISNNYVNLSIPGTVTAESINEKIYFIDDIIPHNFTYKKLDFNMIPLLNQESILANFYSYYLIERNVDK